MRSSDSNPAPGPSGALGPAGAARTAGAAPAELADRWRPGPPPVLLAARCRACGRLSFPPWPQCPSCWQQTDTVPLPRQGTLYTFTAIHVGQSGGEPPRVLGYADFGGVRVLGPLTGAPPWIGAPVTVAEATSGPAGSPSRRYAFQVDSP